MRIDGLWQCDPEQPEVLRPVIPANLRVAENVFPVPMLVDTGADRTVLGSAFSDFLKNAQVAEDETLVSAGGTINSFQVPVQFEFQDSLNRPITFSLVCAVLTDSDQSNTHLLGRDVLDYFTLICDRTSESVTLLRPPHTYTITE